MGTTADKLNKLLETKQAIKQAIMDKGVDISDDTVFADYPSKIYEIENHGGGSGSDGDPFYETMWNCITNNNTDYSYLFHSYKGTSLDVSNFDTSNVTNMSYMFNNCSKLTSLDVSNFDTSKVTDMNYMFNNCSSLTSLDVSNFDTSKVTDMRSMFSGSVSESKLTVKGLSNWDISKVTNITDMFTKNWTITELDLSFWDISKVTSISGAFNNCTKLVDFKAPKNISANMNVSGSTALSHDSLMSIINNLATVTSTKTLTLGTTNLAKLTDEEKAIATNKGWTLK